MASGYLNPMPGVGTPGTTPQRDTRLAFIADELRRTHGIKPGEMDDDEALINAIHTADYAKDMPDLEAFKNAVHTAALESFQSDPNAQVVSSTRMGMGERFRKGVGELAQTVADDATGLFRGAFGAIGSPLAGVVQARPGEGQASVNARRAQADIAEQEAAGQARTDLSRGAAFAGSWVPGEVAAMSAGKAILGAAPGLGRAVAAGVGGGAAGGAAGGGIYEALRAQFEGGDVLQRGLQGAGFGAVAGGALGGAGAALVGGAARALGWGLRKAVRSAPGGETIAGDAAESLGNEIAEEMARATGMPKAAPVDAYEARLLQFLEGNQPKAPVGDPFVGQQYPEILADQVAAASPDAYVGRTQARMLEEQIARLSAQPPDPNRAFNDPFGQHVSPDVVPTRDTGIGFAQPGNEATYARPVSDPTLPVDPRVARYPQGPKELPPQPEFTGTPVQRAALESRRLRKEGIPPERSIVRSAGAPEAAPPPAQAERRVSPGDSPTGTERRAGVNVPPELMDSVMALGKKIGKTVPGATSTTLKDIGGELYFVTKGTSGNESLYKLSDQDIASIMSNKFAAPETGGTPASFTESTTADMPVPADVVFAGSKADLNAPSWGLAVHKDKNAALVLDVIGERGDEWIIRDGGDNLGFVPKSSVDAPREGFKRPGATPPATTKKLSPIAKVRQGTAALQGPDTGYTFDSDLNTYDKGGYIVGVQSKNFPKSATKEIERTVLDLTRQAKDDMKYHGRKHVVGVFEFTDEAGNPVVSVDYNQVEKNRDKAIALGQRGKQKSIWDADKGELVELGNSGLETVDVRETPTGFDATLSKAEEQARRDLGGAQGTLFSNPIPAKELRAVATLAAGALYRGGKKAFTSEMLKEFGPSVRPHLTMLEAKARLEISKRMAEVIRGDQAPSTRRLIQLMSDGKDASQWYNASREEIDRMFGKDSDTFRKIVASLSVGTAPEQNIDGALDAFLDWKLTGQMNRKWVSQDKNLQRAAAGEALSGPKVGPFEKAMAGDQEQVVVDRWMSRMFGYGDKPSAPQVKYITGQIRAMARKHKVTPSEMQAMLWTGLKREMEGPGSDVRDYKVILQDIMAGKLTPKMQRELNARKQGELFDAEP